MKAKLNIDNVKFYLQGNIRYWLYYSKFQFLIPDYIKEQIECRINSMRKSCYNKGYCDKCGCKTTHLQMADKTCDGYCYPEMLDKKTWKKVKKYKSYFDKKRGKVWKLKCKKFV